MSSDYLLRINESDKLSVYRKVISDGNIFKIEINLQNFLPSA